VKLKPGLDYSLLGASSLLDIASSVMSFIFFCFFGLYIGSWHTTAWHFIGLLVHVRWSHVTLFYSETNQLDYISKTVIGCEMYTLICNVHTYHDPFNYWL